MGFLIKLQYMVCTNDCESIGCVLVLMVWSGAIN
jgi:hypothetical protein